jgi:hypothetical protein
VSHGHMQVEEEVTAFVSEQRLGDMALVMWSRLQCGLCVLDLKVRFRRQTTAAGSDIYQWKKAPTG